MKLFMAGFIKICWLIPVLGNEDVDAFCAYPRKIDCNNSFRQKMYLIPRNIFPYTVSHKFRDN